MSEPATARPFRGASPAPASLVDGRLYRVGGSVALDDRVSFVPAGSVGWLPANAYAVVEDDSVLLVDTGLAAHEAAVIGALEQIVPTGRPIKVFITRSEMDCVSNLGPVASRFGIEELYTGGMTNPFDAFDDAASRRQREGDVIKRFAHAGSRMRGSSIARSLVVELSETRRLAVESAVLRMLPTFWVWDESTRTIFTSDSFTHVTCDAADAAPIVDEWTPDPTTVDSLARSLFTRHWWIPYARTDELAAFVEQTFSRLEPEIIAPVRGCVLVGRLVVERHVAMMLEALQEAARWRA